MTPDKPNHLEYARALVEYNDDGATSETPTAAPNVRWFIIPLSVLLCAAAAMVTVYMDNARNLALTTTLISVMAFAVLFIGVLVVNSLIRLGFRGRDRVYRLWCEHGYGVKQKRVKKRRLGTSGGGIMRCKAEAINDVWCWDFIHDRDERGHVLR